MRSVLITLFLTFTSAAAEFDVLLYKDVPNPSGIPTNWPVRVEPTTERPPPWILMSGEFLENYKAFHYPAYSNWYANFRHTNEVAEVQNAILSRLMDDRDLVVLVKAIARYLSVELSAVRQAPTTVFSARTQNQILIGIRSNITVIAPEDWNTNTIAAPPP